MNAKTRVLSKLDQAVKKAADIAIRDGVPIPISDKIILVGSVYLRKNQDETYDILKLNKNCLYTDINLKEVAVIIAQKYNNDDRSNIKNLLYLDEKYSKYHSDLIHYLHCLKSAKRSRDWERLSILEDKFYEAELMVRSIKDQILFYKR